MRTRPGRVHRGVESTGDDTLDLYCSTCWGDGAEPREEWALASLGGWPDNIVMIVAVAGMKRRDDGVWEFTKAAGRRFLDHERPRSMRRRRHYFSTIAGGFEVTSRYAGNMTDYPSESPQLFLCPRCHHVNSYP